MVAPSPAVPVGGDTEFTVDELAARMKVPVRTIREYQTMGVLPPPERRGRIGLYGDTHVGRLELIARLQDRGYSLAGIRDLVGSWRNGSDLGEVLGLQPDQLVHLDEPGSPATLHQLAGLLPALVPDRLGELIAVGLVEACGPDRYCVPSPSLMQLTVDALAAGYPPDAVLGLLRTVHDSTAAIADAVVGLLAEPPNGASNRAIAALAARGRGLLAHGTGRLTIFAIGRRLGVDDSTTLTEAVRANKTKKKERR